jgi:hypothetical protein
VTFKLTDLADSDTELSYRICSAFRNYLEGVHAYALHPCRDHSIANVSTFQAHNGVTEMQTLGGPPLLAIYQYLAHVSVLRRSSSAKVIERGALVCLKKLKLMLAASDYVGPPEMTQSLHIAVGHEETLILCGKAIYRPLV